MYVNIFDNIIFFFFHGLNSSFLFILKMVNYMKLSAKLKLKFQNSSDLIIKTINNTDIIFLESLCSSDKINEYILKTLTLNREKKLNASLIAGPNIKEVINVEDATTYLLNGFTLVSKDKTYAVETKGNLVRSVQSPTAEPDINGPKDSFNESIQTNLGLIKRRIKSADLINDDLTVGKITKTKVSILYLESIAEKQIVNQVKDKLNAINIDGILDMGNLKQLLCGENRSIFPTAQLTERPDRAASSLLEGKIVLICDASAFALIIPSFFADFINPNVDSYAKNINVNFIKVLRFLCLLISIFLPAFYLALINFNQSSIPLSLLVSFAIQRDSVPFPAFAECIFVLIVCAILRESDARFPNSYGSSISIVGALVLGEAAVSAGIVSTIMIIMIAITYITSMVFTDLELINAIRHIRFLALILTCFLGLYGLYMALFIFLIHLSGLTSVNKPYTYPLAPFDPIYFYKPLIRKPLKDDKKRSKLLTDKNYTKQGEL